MEEESSKTSEQQQEPSAAPQKKMEFSLKESREIKEGIAPHIIRQTLVPGKDRPMLVITTFLLHEYVVGGIPKEVLEAQQDLIDSHELSVFPSDDIGLKRGRALKKQKYPSEEECLKAHESYMKMILDGTIR